MFNFRDLGQDNWYEGYYIPKGKLSPLYKLPFI